MKEKKKKFRLPAHVYLMYLMLCTAAVVGVTFSKYITTSSGGDGARVIKMNELVLTESPSAGENLMVVPGTDIEKKVSVSFGGSESACYLFTSVTAPGWTVKNTHVFTAFNENIYWSMNSEWKYLKNENDTYVYYMVLPPNEEIQDKAIIEEGADGLSGRIVVSKNLKNSQIKKLPAMPLTFDAAVVQYDGFGDHLPAGYTPEQHAEAAWDSIKNK